MVTLDDIKAAQQKLRGIAARTPLVRYYPPAEKNGSSQSGNGFGELWLKPESFQPIGAFKLRGAYNKIASLSESERANGVISYSSGNHAQGVAYAARAFGLKCVMVMPRNAPKIKVDATAALGAEIVTVGGSSAERMQRRRKSLPRSTAMRSCLRITIRSSSPGREQWGWRFWKIARMLTWCWCRWAAAG